MANGIMNSLPESEDIIADRVDELVCGKCGATLDVSQVPAFASVACPHCKAPQVVPVGFASFLLVKELGRGAMGVVYEAVDEALRRLVAIKVMRGVLAKDAKFAEQFMHEARALAALNHRNVVQIYSCGEEKGQLYIAMELVRGGRFDDLVSAGEPLGERFILKVAIDVVQGLAAACHIGLFHGDVKPQNILFDLENTAKVVDFGLARFRGEHAGQEGQIWGTPLYIAPECARSQLPDKQSDIYSLGATLFHALVGNPPFVREKIIDTVLARLQEPPPDIAKLRSDLHPETSAVVGRMLKADRFERYPNYESLLEDLRSALAASGAAVGKKPKRKSRAPVIVIALVVLALAAAVVGGLKWKSARAPSAPPAATARPKIAKVVGGKLVYVDAPAPAPAAAPAGPIPRLVELAPVADGYVQGAGGKPPTENSIFDTDEALWVRAGRDTAIHLVRKTYLRFDLAQAGATEINDASLRLTIALSGVNKRDRYELSLWGLKHSSRAWSDDWEKPDTRLTWMNAPANDRTSGSAMTSDAVLLAKITFDGAVVPGTDVVFSNSDSVEPDAFLGFLNANRGHAVTLAITADSATDQRTGWRFASRENGRIASPKLLIERGPSAK